MSIVNPTTSIALERQVTGTNNNTWNDRYSANFARIDAAIGAQSVDVTGTSVTLTSTDSGDTNADAQTRPFILRVTGTPGSARTVTWPSGLAKRIYHVRNECGSPLTCTLGLGTGVSLAIGECVDLYYSGTNITRANVPQMSLAASGYTMLPGGMILQWGSVSTNGSGVGTVTFPLAFPNNVFNWVAQVSAASGVSSYVCQTALPSVSGGTVYTSSAGAGVSAFVYWHAIGN